MEIPKRAIQEIIEYSKSLPSIRKMERQLTNHEAESLLKAYPLDDIKNQLAKMDNWKNVTKNLSVYMTVMKWFEMDIQKGFYKRPTKQDIAKLYGGAAPEAQGDDARLAFLEKFPVGSKIVSTTGRIFRVIDRMYLENLSEPESGVLPIEQALKGRWKLAPQIEEFFEEDSK